MNTISSFISGVTLCSLPTPKSVNGDDDKLTREAHSMLTLSKQPIDVKMLFFQDTQALPNITITLLATKEDKDEGIVVEKSIEINNILSNKDKDSLYYVLWKRIT